jgi:hypothetical protein
MPMLAPQSMSNGVQMRPRVSPIDRPEITTPSPSVRRLGGVWVRISVRSFE